MRWLLFLAVLFINIQLAFAGDAPTPKEAASASPVPKIFVVQVTLTRSPLSRVHVHFSHEATGLQVETAWDPNQVAPLSKVVHLSSDGTWKVSVWSESLGMSADLHQDHLVQYKPPSVQQFSLGNCSSSPSSHKAKATLTIVPTDLYKVDSAQEAKALQEAKIDITLEQICDGFSIEAAAQSLTFGGAEGGGQRSVADGISKVAGDVFQILAEIAFERAKAKSFDLLTSRVVHYACDALTWDAALFGNSLHASRGASKHRLLLPNTCQAVKNLRIQELTAASKALYQAFLADLAETAMEANVIAVTAHWEKSLPAELTADQRRIEAQVQLLRQLLHGLKPFVKDLAQGKARPSAQQAQLIVTSLRDVLFESSQVVSDAELQKLSGALKEQASRFREELCVARLGLAILGTCNKKAGCAPAELRAMVVNFQTFFAAGECATSLATAVNNLSNAGNLEAWRAELISFISRGHDLLYPPAGSGGTSQLRSSIGLTFDVVERLCSAEKSCTALGVLPPLRKLVTGILDNDVQTILVSLISILEGRLRELGNKNPLFNGKGEVNDFDFFGGLARSFIKLPTNPRKLLEPDTQKQLWKALEELPEGVNDARKAQTELIQTLRSQELRKLMQDPCISQLVQSKGQNTCVLSLERAEQLVGLYRPTQELLQALRDYESRGKKTLLAFQKIAQIIGAVTAYASNYSADPKADPKLAQAQHDARKKAIESLIDASTQRNNRDGDWVVSVGANVGFFTGQQYAVQRIALTPGDGRSNETFVTPNLSLPMGLAVQWLPNRNYRGLCGKQPNRMLCQRPASVGMHFQLSFIDLAQFLAYDRQPELSPVHWANFFTLGGQVGMIVGTPTLPFVLSFEARWAPTLFKEEFVGALPCPENEPMCSQPLLFRQGIYRIGASLSFYVPFFDFN